MSKTPNMTEWLTRCEISQDERDKWAQELLNRPIEGDQHCSVDYIFSGDTVVLKITYASGVVRLMDCKVRRMQWNANE
jgi:hypothetical protein